MAKAYHCKVIKSKDDEYYYEFPVFKSETNAKKFKSAIDTLMVLK